MASAKSLMGISVRVHTDAAVDLGGSLPLLMFCIICSLLALIPTLKGRLIKRPVACLRLSISRTIQRMLYLVAAPQILQNAYRSAAGTPFVVHTPSNSHVMVSSERHAQELVDAPTERLSLHAIAKELLQPKHTMHGFEWQDTRGTEGTGFVRALRSLLTSHLPALVPDLQESVASSISDGLAKGQIIDDESHVRVFSFVKEIVAKGNCVMFFGKELSKNEEFTSAALQYPQDVIFAAELLRITPEFLRPLVAYASTRGHRATSTLYRTLEPEVRARLAARQIQRDGRHHTEVHKNDCMQWLIDTSPRKNPWTCQRMIGEIMAVWFGSVHQLAMATTYAIHDLCDHPDMIGPLRREVAMAMQQEPTAGVDKMELLDSFTMESARTSCSDAVSVRRKALQRFQFSDGVEVKPGDWACMPQMAMMQDAAQFEDASAFNAFRFASQEAIARATGPETPRGVCQQSIVGMKLTDVSHKWLVWGLGNTACPGRFYASTMLKLILSHILATYECRRPEGDDGQRSRSRSWRSSIVPREGAVIAFRRRG